MENNRLSLGSNTSLWKMKWLHQKAFQVCQVHSVAVQEGMCQACFTPAHFGSLSPCSSILGSSSTWWEFFCTQPSWGNMPFPTLAYRFLEDGDLFLNFSCFSILSPTLLQTYLFQELFGGILYVSGTENTKLKFPLKEPSPIWRTYMQVYQCLAVCLLIDPRDI